MKSLAVFFVFLVLAAVFVPCVPVRAEPSLVPHEDPGTVQSVMDAYSFLAQYADIFALMASKDYSNASRLSEQLSHITVPEDLRYVITRYNDLTQQLIIVLNDLDNSLNSASNFLDQYRLDEANQSLTQAGVLVAKAQILISDLKDATSTMSQRLGVFAASADNKIRQAYSQLQTMLQRLLDLINLYHTLLERSNQRIEEIISENLDPTTLTLTLNATSCFVGGYISASGTLTSRGQILGSRAVQLSLDGNKISTANTDAKGHYNALIEIPYKYVDSVSVNALYTPFNNDRGVYLASLSPTVKVQVLFYKTYLNVSIPSGGYPGLALSIKGVVSSQNKNPLNERQVKVTLDGAIIAQAQTDQTGAFTTKSTIATQTKLGSHNLTVTVDPQGLYNGASTQRTLTIQKISTTIQVTVPSFAIIPTQLHINGTVKSASNPLSDATMQIAFANESVTVKTLTDGSFNLTMDLPLETIFAGYQNLKVSAQPSQPWQATTQTTTSVFVLNSVGIGIALASSLSVGLVIYFRFTKNKNTKDKKTAEASAVFSLPAKEATAIVVPAIAETKFEGLKGKVLKAYIETVKAVQAATGEPLMANMTLREYTAATRSKIGDAAEPFSGLTILAERSLYSPYAPNEEDAEKAEKLANTARRILNNAVA